MTATQSNSPEIALDYVAEAEEKFIRVYDQDTDQMVGKWVYPNNFKTDQQLADLYAHLGYKNPRACNVTVPVGIRIRGLAAQVSNKPYVFELESGKGIVFDNDRALPPANPPQAAAGPRKILEYTPDQEAFFVCVYENASDIKAAWLLDPKQVEGKSPAQLQAFFGFPFAPKFICDVKLPPKTKIQAYASANVRRPNLYHAEFVAEFFNARPLT